MAKKRRKRTVSRVISALLGFVCALLLSALFYGTMAYQLAGGDQEAAVEQTGGVLSLSEGELTGETTHEETVGGALCHVTVREYALPSGQNARAITAKGASYLEKLSLEGVVMQLITGFVIDDMDAVYAISGETGILAARSGNTVYMIEANVDQQTLYALGAGAGRTPSVSPAASHLPQ